MVVVMLVVVVMDMIMSKFLRPCERYGYMVMVIWLHDDVLI